MLGRKFSLAALWKPRKDQEQNSISMPPTTMSEVFQVALLLRQLPLPPDIIPDILDFASLWSYTTAATNTQSQVVSERNAGVVHCIAAIPSNIHRLSVRSVVFRTVSHDQGWSWDKANHGTYDGSTTWFEAGLLVPQISVPTLQDCRKIVTNVHACRDDKEHRVEWFDNDPDPYVQLIFRRLRAGESIGINVCALYPGWQNLVKESSIGFTFQPVRRMP
jgi:hypothetical protein